MIVEVAASSTPFDLNEKKEAYRRNGVREYIVWQTEHRRVDWFSLEAGQYVALPPDVDGIMRSRVFPGLWLNVTALLGGGMAEVLAVLQQGLGAPEHAAFVERLQRARS